MEPNDIKIIFQRYLDNCCSPEECRLLFAHFKSSDDLYLRELIAAELAKAEDATDDQHLVELSEAVYYKIDQNINPVRRIMQWPRIAAAVIGFLIVSVGAFILFKPRPQQVAENVHPHYNIPIGGNKAFLVLGDGRRISLNEAASGTIARQGQALVQKTGSGQLVYEDTHSGHNVVPVYNTIETPRGGQYQVVLPDGTHVWLNSASSLHYPAQFSGRERRVELSGEAYFEVVHNSAMPFHVSSSGQDVEVLGTHFNIMAYSDEGHARTTLLEGSVRLTQAGGVTALLAPGQQAVNDSGHFQVSEADTEEAVAWKNGYFRFNGENIETVMRQLARWYPIEVRYSGVIPSVRFYGTISRNKNIGEVLAMLKQTKDIKMTVEGTTVTVGE